MDNAVTPQLPAGQRTKPGQTSPAVSYNSKTGRPIRRSAGKTASPFVDSAVAISDEAESDRSDSEQDVTSDDEGIKVVTSRKRKRTPSPPLSEASISDSEGDAILSDYGNAVALRNRPAQSIEQVAPIQLTVNVPAGPERQIVLNIDLNSYLGQQPILSSASNTSLPPTKRAKTRGRSLEQTVASSSVSRASSRSERAGFLDLPAELRNEVYRLAFVSPARFDFGAPNKHFQRSSAFLRTCRQVYTEGRSILYSENEFFFQRQSRRYGPIWAADWGELGFKPVRKFLKMIGPSNTSFIRHVTMLFEDAQPSLNPQMHNAEERRFVHDENLHSVLRHLATHGTLARFYMNFQGRKTLDVYYPNDHFLDLLTRIRADDVMFVKHPVWAPHSTYHSRSKQSNGVVQMCFESMLRKKKLFLTQ